MNPDAVGRAGDVFEMPIERSKIRELALATGSNQEAYFGRHACVPATFFTTMFGWMSPEHNPWSFLDINPLNSVQAFQEYEFVGAMPVAGSVLYGQSRVESIYEKTGHQGRVTLNVVIRTDFRDATGELRVISRLVVAEFTTQSKSTSAAPHRRSGHRDLDGGGGMTRETEVMRESVANVPTPGWVAAPPGPREIGPLRLLDFVRYEGATAHFNPVHFDSEIAKRAGCDKPFAVGMLLAGYLATWATDWLGPQNVRRIWFEFRRRVWLGEMIVIGGGSFSSKDNSPLLTPTGIDIHDTRALSADESVVHVKLSCQTPEGHAAVVGGATFVRGLQEVWA